MNADPDLPPMTNKTERQSRPLRLIAGLDQ
jgi:hypothetical protein